MEHIKLDKSSNEMDLRVNFNKKLENKYFNSICHNLGLKEDKLMKYTSQLMECSQELENCSKCKGLNECKNSVKGSMLKPDVYYDDITFSYVNCKYFEQEKYRNNIVYYDLPKKIREASFANLYTDKTRVEIIKKVKEFMDLFLKGKSTKGIYLHGNFGSGKTYIISALFNELAKKGYKSVAVPVPELIRSIKDSFKDDYSERYEHIRTTPILLLDDIGSEYLTPWARDEVLGPILQYRMDNDLPIFFTSNFTLEELEEHLAMNTDKVGAKRIIERIKHVSIPMSLIGKNRRE